MRTPKGLRTTDLVEAGPSSASEAEASLGYMRLSQNKEIKQEKKKKGKVTIQGCKEVCG